MAISDKDFKDIESAVDRLFESKLTTQQREDATTLFRVAYRIIHKANNQIFEAKQLQYRAVNSLGELELYKMPVNTVVQ